ncbi:hypothetical protein D1AOALGA4SA_5253 [Olavius algarvensis Delta 1 endosymbiont]|nr:hypothetical protein D1AOALGA4SA_5253 [Olavius algarvensis Delta 1 endosymbiont]
MLIGCAILPILVWQLPRWSKGLDPTFLHPNFFGNSEIPFFMYLAKLHPAGWLIIIEWTHKRKNSHYISMIR